MAISNTDSFRSIGDRFNFPKSSVEYIFQRVVKALCQIAPSVIIWPRGETAKAVITSFEQIAGFPGVIGAIDGSHIPIKAPTDYPETYINRKGFHSIILQAVSDSKMMFLDSFVGFPGSVHDARVLKNSDLYKMIVDGQTKMIPENMHIIGDAAYPLLEWLIPPFKDNGHLTKEQKSFNSKLSSTRCAVERAFALLKGRFRRLKYLDMNSPASIVKSILAACVLHNICLRGDDESYFQTLIAEGSEAIPELINENNNKYTKSGISKRHELMMTMEL